MSGKRTRHLRRTESNDSMFVVNLTTRRFPACDAGYSDEYKRSVTKDIKNGLGISLVSQTQTAFEYHTTTVFG